MNRKNKLLRLFLVKVKEAARKFSVKKEQKIEEQDRF